MLVKLLGIEAYPWGESHYACEDSSCSGLMFIWKLAEATVILSVEVVNSLVALHNLSGNLAWSGPWWDPLVLYILRYYARPHCGKHKTSFILSINGGPYRIVLAKVFSVLLYCKNHVLCIWQDAVAIMATLRLRSLVHGLNPGLLSDLIAWVVNLTFASVLTIISFVWLVWITCFVFLVKLLGAKGLIPSNFLGSSFIELAQALY